MTVDRIAFVHQAVNLLKMLHRHDDGYISLAIKDEDDLRPFLAFRASEIGNQIPLQYERLAKNSYISINASFCLNGRNSEAVSGYPSHREANLRYLCACFCDIDFYTRGFTRAEVDNELRRIFDSGQLPQFSFIIDSGHGLWVLWLLHNEKDLKKAHFGAYSDNQGNHLCLYKLINRKIGEILAHLGADRGAVDGVRHLRFPGSFRTDSEQFVEWTSNLNEKSSDGPPTYSLSELAKLLGLTPKAKSPKRNASDSAPKKCPEKHKGMIAMHRNRLQAFNCLKDLRGGGFSEGLRNNAAFLYAMCMRLTEISRREAIRNVRAMALCCTPPLSEYEVHKTVMSAYKHPMWKLSYQHIANKLHVLEAEACAIATEIGTRFPASSEFNFIAEGELIRPPSNKKVIRGLEIRKIVETKGYVPSYREMKKCLAEIGVNINSHVTVKNDYARLGISPSCKAEMQRRHQNPRAKNIAIEIAEPVLDDSIQMKAVSA